MIPVLLICVVPTQPLTISRVDRIHGTLSKLVNDENQANIALYILRIQHSRLDAKEVARSVVDYIGIRNTLLPSAEQSLTGYRDYYDNYPIYKILLSYGLLAMPALIDYLARQDSSASDYAKSSRGLAINCIISIYKQDDCNAAVNARLRILQAISGEKNQLRRKLLQDSLLHPSMQDAKEELEKLIRANK